MSTLAVAGIAQSETRHSNQIEGTLTFDSNGNLTSPNEIVSEISFPGMAHGASTLTFKWNLNGSGSTPTATQLASPNNNLIVAQRAFETNSKTMTAFDTISQDVLAIVRCHSLIMVRSFEASALR
jgi:hypothetical protein